MNPKIALLSLAWAAIAATPLAAHAAECEGAPSANKLSIVIENVSEAKSPSELARKL